jgi:hypothetical protein
MNPYALVLILAHGLLLEELVYLRDKIPNLPQEERDPHVTGA